MRTKLSSLFHHQVDLHVAGHCTQDYGSASDPLRTGSANFTFWGQDAMKSRSIYLQADGDVNPTSEKRD